MTFTNFRCRSHIAPHKYLLLRATSRVVKRPTNVHTTNYPLIIIKPYPGLQCKYLKLMLTVEIKHPFVSLDYKTEHQSWNFLNYRSLYEYSARIIQHCNWSLNLHKHMLVQNSVSIKNNLTLPVKLIHDVIY